MKFLVLVIPLAVYLLTKPYSVGQVLGDSTTNTSFMAADVLASETTISAKTAFDEKTVEVTEELAFETNYQNDNDMEIGEEKVLEEGAVGTKTLRYLVTYWFDEEIDKQLVGIDTVEPRSELVARGTKVVWRELSTEIGRLKYWRKIKVWATKYDGNCEGCRGLTYSGTLVRKGVCAVDPKVISLGTNFYVEGYGMCRSEDIGGGIKGNEVDLGYEDVSKGEWRTGWTTVYLLTSAPEN